MAIKPFRRKKPLPDLPIFSTLREISEDERLAPATREQRLEREARRIFGPQSFEATFNPETGCVDLFLVLIVVAGDTVVGRELSLSRVEQFGLESEVGDELLFQIFFREEDAERATEQDEQFGELLAELS